MIPGNISHEDIIKAIQEIDNSGVPEDRLPSKYYVVYNDKSYPPKYVLSLANKYANGNELHPSTFSGGDETNPFLKERGFEVVLIADANKNSAKWLAVTDEENWEKCLEHRVWGANDNRSTGLQQMKVGDDILVYVKQMKLAGIFRVTREHFHDTSKIWRNGIFPHRISFEPTERVPEEPVDIRSFYNTKLKPKKGSARGYFGMGMRKLPLEEFKLFENILIENLQRKPNVFVTGYDESNLRHSIRNKTLGWRNKSKLLTKGDYVFVYNKDTHKIDASFKVLEKSDNAEPMWDEELESDRKKLEFPHRWSADLICENLDVSLDTINTFPPFNGRAVQKFIPLVGNNFPTPLAREEYSKFREFLIGKCDMNRAVSAEETYLILRTQPGSLWQDKEGKEYHFGTNVPRHSAIVPGVRVVFDTNLNGQIHFLGHAKVQSIREENRGRTTQEGRQITDKIAVLHDYFSFSTMFSRSEKLKTMIESIPGYNNQHSIRPITKEIFAAILKEAEPKPEGWNFDLDKVVDEIIARDTDRELAIDREIVKRILLHLKSGKHVMLVGPPGVGKTDLARRVLKIVGKRVTGKEQDLEAVASDEWSRFEVIGGINLQNQFQEGWVVKAALDDRWLLIDEFNRANMNRAFGEMFLTIEYREIKLRPAESKVFGKEVVYLPEDFRMICTMNDFDKNLLLAELSYGLISRFAFVSITPDTEREVGVVAHRVKPYLGEGTDYGDYQGQINTYFVFIDKVRKQRNIGVRTSIDVIKYLVAASAKEKDPTQYWLHLNNALCDYLLPQFDRLDRETIEGVLEAANRVLTDAAFAGFKKELTESRDRLKRAMGWLSNKDAGS